MPEFESTLPRTWNPKRARTEDEFHERSCAIVFGLRRPMCNWCFPALFVPPWTVH